MSKPSKAYHAVSEMEDTIADVERWGELLYDFGAGEGEVKRDGLFVLGRAIIALSQRLHEEWSAVRTAVMEGDR